MTSPDELPAFFTATMAALDKLEEAADRDLKDIIQGKHLAFARRTLEITVDNDDAHTTVRFKPWHEKVLDARGRPQNVGLQFLPRFFHADVKTNHRPYGWHPVGKAMCYWPEGAVPAAPGEPTFRWRWDLRELAGYTASLPMAYAAHLCFLQLTGTDIFTQPWVDAKGIERDPTDRYVFRPVVNCLRCGLELRQPSSIDVGYGEDCAAHIRAMYIKTRTRALR